MKHKNCQQILKQNMCLQISLHLSFGQAKHFTEKNLELPLWRQLASLFHFTAVTIFRVLLGLSVIVCLDLGLPSTCVSILLRNGK